MAEAVYLLCALTSVMCTLLLLRGYRRTKARLLMWSSACFAALAVNNVLLFVDLVILPEIDLSVWRNLSALVGIFLMLWGLIWDSREC